MPTIDSEDFDDPTYSVFPNGGAESRTLSLTSSYEEMSFEELLKKQIYIAGSIQERICDPNQHYEIKEIKDLVMTSSSLLTLAQRSGEALSSLETYRVFLSIVVEFLKRRRDTTGEDLLSELKEISHELRASKVHDQVMSSMK